MELYQRLENAMDEGRRMSELNHRYLYLRETLWDYLHGYNPSAMYNKPESSFSPGDWVPGRIYGNIGLDACCKESNEIRSERGYAFRGKKLSKLERFVGDFGYNLGYKIEKIVQWYRVLAWDYDVWKYD